MDLDGKEATIPSVVYDVISIQDFGAKGKIYITNRWYKSNVPQIIAGSMVDKYVPVKEKVSNFNPAYVVCMSKGNPDFNETQPKSKPMKYPVDDLKTAAKICQKYIEENDLGGGNWVGKAGFVYDKNNKLIAKISYNGRIWDLGNKEITESKSFRK